MQSRLKLLKTGALRYAIIDIREDEKARILANSCTFELSLQLADQVNFSTT